MRAKPTLISNRTITNLKRSYRLNIQRSRDKMLAWQAFASYCVLFNNFISVLIKTNREGLTGPWLQGHPYKVLEGCWRKMGAWLFQASCCWPSPCPFKRSSDLGILPSETISFRWSKCLMDWTAGFKQALDPAFEGLILVGFGVNIRFMLKRTPTVVNGTPNKYGGSSCRRRINPGKKRDRTSIKSLIRSSPPLRGDWLSGFELSLGPTDPVIATT